jgi:hypothetical protein
MIQKFHFQIIPKRTESKSQERYLYNHVHSSISDNSQNMEATQVPTNKWMYKQNMIYKYTNI